MMAKWRNEILSDPYYSPNLTSKAEDFSIDFSKPESFYCVYTQDLSGESVGNLHEGKKIGQKAIIDQDNLCAISIKFGTFQSVCKGTVRFYLRHADEPGVDLRVVSVDSSLIRDNEYHLFAFDPMPDSSRRAYYFFVEDLRQEQVDALTIWKSHFNSDAM